MRECVYKAGLITSFDSDHLDFTTERMSIISIILSYFIIIIVFNIVTIISVSLAEAAALHCLTVVKQHNLQPFGTFIILLDNSFVIYL
jgi:hypothetical protein